jgi:hypothetical protein
LEEALAKTQKELLKAQEANAKLQRDLRENVAQKEDQVRLLDFLLLFISLCSILQNMFSALKLHCLEIPHHRTKP